MNRTNVGKQLSGFVGRDIDSQFVRPRQRLYAEGDTVAEELVTKTFENGKTWTWNPAKESEPDPETGRTKKYDEEGKLFETGLSISNQLGKVGGVNLFGQATLVQPDKEATGQKVPVPVSVSIVPRNEFVDPITDPAFSESKYKSSIYSINQLEDEAKDAALAGKIISGILPGGMLLHDPLQKYLIGGLRKEITHPDRGVLEKEQWEQANRDPVGGKKREPKYFDREKEEDEDESELGKFLAQARNLKALADATGMGRSFGRTEKGSNLSAIRPTNYIEEWGKSDPTSDLTEPSLHLGQTDPKSQAIVARASPEYQSYAGDVGEEYFEDRSYGEELGQLTHEDNWSYGASGGAIPFAHGGGLSSIGNQHLEPGSFVLAADVVSGAGDGDTQSGLKRLHSELGIPVAPSGTQGSSTGGPISGSIRGPGSGLDDMNQTSIDGRIPAALSNGETVLARGSVARIAQLLHPDKKMTSNEALKLGQEGLFNLQKNIRKQKAGTSKGGKQPGPLNTGRGGLLDLMRA